MSAAVYVGPARVLRMDGERPHVQVLGGGCETATADWALPFRYEPATGDLLLVIGQSGRYWVTGIVHGAGRSQLAFAGHTELNAAGGPLHLSADGGVRIQSPAVGVEADVFETETNATHQRLDQCDSEVSGTLDERSGESMRDIDGEDAVTAAQTSTVAARVAKIDGGLLRLS
ncbi:MAG: hypothetical protein ACE37K_08275 [Planctomycetota bacterium]